MVPDRPPEHRRLVNGNVSLSPELWEQLDEITKAEKVRSRNALIGSYLRFATDLLPRLTKVERRIQEISVERKWSMAEVFFELIQLGLAAYEKRGKR